MRAPPPRTLECLLDVPVSGPILGESGGPPLCQHVAHDGPPTVATWRCTTPATCPAGAGYWCYPCAYAMRVRLLLASAQSQAWDCPSCTWHGRNWLDHFIVERIG